MSDALDLLAVARDIQHHSKTLDNQGVAFKHAVRAYLDADREFDVAYAQAYLRARASDSKPSVDDAKMMATVATQDEYRSKVIAESAFRACREAGANLREQLSALRSVSSASKALTEI